MDTDNDQGSLDLLVRTPASRAKDGLGSADAEARINKNGKRARDQRQVLRGFIAHPMTTTKELADLTGMDRYVVGRRAPELAEYFLHKAEPPPGTAKGKREFRWMATEAGKRVAAKWEDDK